jgi:hypothetical protein
VRLCPRFQEVRDVFGVGVRQIFLVVGADDPLERVPVVARDAVDEGVGRGRRGRKRLLRVRCRRETAGAGEKAGE